MKLLINYTLHNRRHYTSLYELLDQWNAVRLTDSLWLAELRGTAAIVRDIVVSKLDHDDTIAVLELQPGSDWATRNVAPVANDWLSYNVTAVAA